MGNFLKWAEKGKQKITCNQEYGIPRFCPSRVPLKETAVYGVDSEGFP